MKISGKQFPRLFLVGILFLVSFQPGDRSGKKGSPLYEGEILIDGLNSSVTIFRDQRGMPHIYAGDEHDLYFATGFVTAQERLWEMDLIRRTVTGRLSEIFGKKYIKADLFSRCLGIQSKAARIISGENDTVLECLRSFSDGVNYYINNTCERLPVEFRILSYKPDQWTPEDIAGIVGMISWGLAEKNLNSELFSHLLVRKAGYEKTSSLFPQQDNYDNVVYPGYNVNEETASHALAVLEASELLRDIGLNAFPASNNWVVAGNRSVTGKPVFSNDMHLPLYSPGIWMQMHQVIPGKLNVTGVLIPGEPFIIAGHNEHIAWGMTNMVVDDIDLYSERINEESGKHYFFNGEWRDLVVKAETIRIKGREPEVFKTGYTHRGPLISEMKQVSNAALSMKWTAAEESDEVRTCYLLNRASGWDEFRNALEYFKSLNQNIAYADISGNIGLTSAGRIPIRKNTGPFIRDGQTDEFDWKGFVPDNQLPFSFNPESGYVSSANNVTLGRDYPYYINFLFNTPYRINRIREMIEEKEKFTVDDFRRMINDQHSDCAAHLIPYIMEIEKMSGKLTHSEVKALEILKSWDYDMKPDLVAPSVFEYFKLKLAENILADEMGELYGKACIFTIDNYIHYIADEGNGEWIDNICTEEKESLNDIVFLSFRECIKELEDRYGKNQDKWKWGRLHTLKVKHPMGSVRVLDFLYGLNSPEYPVGGSFNTVSMFGDIKNGFSVNVGASVKNIYNTADWDESWSIIPAGESGIPRSEFYLSQTKTYVEGGLYRDHFSEKAVIENARYRLVLRAD